MFYRSGIAALLLSGGIALLTTILLFALDILSRGSVILAFMILFVIGFGIIFVALEHIIIKPIRNMRETMAGLDETQEFKDVEEPALASLTKVSHKMERLATEKQNEIDALKKQEAFRKNFIADISHELKTPIFAAQGFIHTLLDGAVKDKSVRKKFLKKAAKSLDGLDELVQGLLTLSQIETGQIKMRFRKFDLYALTEEVFEQYSGKLNKRDVGLRIDGPVRKVMVLADCQRISQVMSNLISNAIKYSARNGEVVVTFSPRKKSVVTSVRDFGAGIPADDLDRIFERFYRVDKSRSREKGGTGLGLAIVKHILEGHNTRPKVASEPGKGSTFSFKLPRARAEKNEHGEDQQSEEQ